MRVYRLPYLLLMPFYPTQGEMRSATWTGTIQMIDEQGYKSWDSSQSTSDLYRLDTKYTSCQQYLQQLWEL